MGKSRMIGYYHTQMWHFFKNKRDRAKKFKLKKKENWVQDANTVIETYEGLMNCRGRITDYMYIWRRHDG